MCLRHEHGPVRRRANGTIDIDFYRRRGLVLRRAAMSEAFRCWGRMAGPLIAAAVVGLLLGGLADRIAVSRSG